MARVLNRNWNHTYQLILNDDGDGMARTIEFEAAGREAALYIAQQQCRGREAEVIEDGRSLGRVQCVPRGGYWRLSPAPAEPPFSLASPASPSPRAGSMRRP